MSHLEADRAPMDCRDIRGGRYYFDRMEIHYILLPLRSHFETSFGCAYQRDTILIRLRADGVDGVRHPSKLLLVFPRNGGNRVAYAERLPGAGISERRN